MLAKKPAAGWANSTFLKTSLPMFGFVVFAWYGLSQLMESKLQIRVSRAAVPLSDNKCCKDQAAMNTPICRKRRY